MRQTITIAIALLLSSCSQSTEVPASHPPENGTYTGTFYFSQDGVAQTGEVTFVFADSTYQCVPNSSYLPPAGGGSYKVAPGSMTLTDLMMHTAEFDWTLILGGEFMYMLDGSKIVLTQDDAKRNRSRRIELLRQK